MSDNNCDVQRRQNMGARMAAENIMEDRQRQQRQYAKQSSRNQEQNDALSAELQRMKIDEEKREREIQRICQEAPELQELENRLKMAYMNKERGQQLTEASQLTEMEKRRQLAIEQKMEYDRQEGLVREQEAEQARRYEAIQQKAVLQTQMLEREKMMEEAHQAYLKDKDMVDSVYQKILDEDRKDQEEKYQKVALTKQEIEKFKIQRAQELEDARLRQEQEDNKIRMYAQERVAREQGVQAKKAEKAASEERAFKAIEEKLERERREQGEMDRLRNELWTEEAEHRLREKEISKRKAREDARMDMMRANGQQKEMKQLKLVQQRREDEEIKARMLQKFADDERREAEAERRRNDQKNIFKTNIEEGKKEKEDLYQNELEQEMRRRAEIAEEERFRAQVIEEARKRMLEEHARALSGFLPKGVLSNKEDLSFLQQFDTNGDGQLDDDELSKAQRQFMNYDDNGDGKLDESEKQTAYNALKSGQFR